MRKPTWREIKEYYFDPQFLEITKCWLHPYIFTATPDEAIPPATDLHHGVINKAKFRSRSFHKYLDVIENAVPVCRKCHLYADAYEIRRIAYQLKVEELGKERMEKWLDSLPVIIKENLK